MVISIDESKFSEFRKTNMIPFNNAMEIISGKWKMNILYSLSQLGTMRYGEIKRVLGNVTHKMLSKKLKELEENGLIIRKEYPQISPKVEYSLTDKGRTLLPILKQVCDWGKEYCPKKIKSIPEQDLFLSEDAF